MSAFGDINTTSGDRYGTTPESVPPKEWGHCRYSFSLQYTLITAPTGNSYHIFIKVTRECNKWPWDSKDRPGFGISNKAVTQHGNETHTTYSWKIKQDCDYCDFSGECDLTWIRDREGKDSDKCMDKLVANDWSCLYDWRDANKKEEDWPDTSKGNLGNIPMQISWGSGDKAPKTC
jgi:hypothetical protein